MPDKACPMLLPEADIVAPKIISAAPPPPMKTAALTTGVENEARSGSVPSATTCASVMIAATHAMVTISAKGTARRGSRVSPATTGTTS